MENKKNKACNTNIRIFIILIFIIGIIIGITIGVFKLLGNEYKWIKKNGKWYYINEQNNTFKIGWIKSHGFTYYLDKNGVRQTGWIKNNGNWYYFYKAGEMATDVLLNIDGKTYYFDTTGIMGTGWIKYKDYYHYFSEGTGVMLTGWQDIGNAWYYLYSTGEMATGVTTLGDNSFYFDDKGVMHTGWIKVDEMIGSSKNRYVISHWYYGDENGRLKTFWQQIDNKWYYFFSNREMAHNVLVNGFYFDSSGCWSSDIPKNIRDGNALFSDSDKPEVVYWETIPVIVTDISSGDFGSATITVKTDKYDLTNTFTQSKDKPYADVLNSGELKVGDTIYAELYTWKKGTSIVTKQVLHELKYNN